MKKAFYCLDCKKIDSYDVDFDRAPSRCKNCRSRNLWEVKFLLDLEKCKR